MLILLFLLVLFVGSAGAQGTVNVSPFSGILWHNTDCRTGITTARVDQICGDRDDNTTYRCATPAAGGASTTFCDQTSEWVAVAGGASAGVSSFNGRTGAVSPASNDYTGALVSNSPTGSIAATTTQGAINELATDKAEATTLSGAGTINNAGNPVDWTQLKNVPAGFADGSDDGAGASTPTLQAVADAGRVINNATSTGTALAVGEGTRRHLFYCSTTECVWAMTTAQDLIVRPADNFDWAILDSTGANIINVDEATRTTTFNGPIQVTGGIVRSVEVMGREFGGCAFTEVAVATNKPRLGTFTCGDNDNDGFDFDFVMPNNWNGGTVRVRLSSHSVNATPSGNVVLHCSGNAVSDGEVIPDKSTTGEQPVSMTLAAQYQEEQATSNPITLNGTGLAGGDHIYMHCDVDVTLNTPNSVPDVRIHATAKVLYSVTVLGE